MRRHALNHAGRVYRLSLQFLQAQTSPIVHVRLLFSDHNVRPDGCRDLRRSSIIISNVEAATDNEKTSFRDLLMFYPNEISSAELSRVHEALKPGGRVLKPGSFSLIRPKVLLEPSRQPPSPPATQCSPFPSVLPSPPSSPLQLLSLLPPACPSRPQSPVSMSMDRRT